MKIIFLNGPPRAGKDTSAKLLRPFGFSRASFADDLKDRFERAFNGLRPEGEAKELPMPPPFDDATYRQGLIAFSEKFMKPLFGEHIFGKILIEQLKLVENIPNTLLHIDTNTNVPLEGFAISDSGFALEALPVVQHFGKDNCRLVQVHRSDCSFAGDSRGWLKGDVLGLGTYTVYNNGTEEELLDQLKALLRRWNWL